MNDKSDLFTGLGIMFVLLGIGGCSYLLKKGDAEKIQAEQQIKIENSFNTSTNKP